MDQTSLTQALQGLPLNKVVYLPTIGSTNDEVVKLAEGGAKAFSLVVADQQSKGRGRSGRNWHTPPGAAIAMSVLLPTDGISGAELARVTGLGALAVCEALQQYELDVQIKWPNDVLINGKKACGVLAEAHWRGDILEHLVIGIGINVATTSVPPIETLNFPAVSIQEALGHQIKREELIREVLASMQNWWPRLGTAEFISAWESHLAYMNENVEIVSATQETEPVSGTLVGLNNLGHLRLKLPTGEENSLEASEIHLRPRVDSRAN